MVSNARRPVQGIGIGLRQLHIKEILEDLPSISWFEVLTDNHMVAGGPVLRQLEQICQHYPVVFHSVGLSIGSSEPLDYAYLKKLKAMNDRFKPQWVSEHLCWTSAHGHHFHDLLPLPYTEETIDHVARRVREVQDFLDCQILLENVSSYLSFKNSEMTEWEFISEVAKRADSLILLDVNNIYVSSYNHGFAPEAYLRDLPADRIRQLHLAGYEEHETHLLDTHSTAPSEPVWELFAQVIKKYGPIPTLIEWDANIPPLAELLQVAARAKEIHKNITVAAA